MGRHRHLSALAMSAAKAGHNLCSYFCVAPGHSPAERNVCLLVCHHKMKSSQPRFYNDADASQSCCKLGDTWEAQSTVWRMKGFLCLFTFILLDKYFFFLYKEPEGRYFRLCGKIKNILSIHQNTENHFTFFAQNSIYISGIHLPDFWGDVARKDEGFPLGEIVRRTTI